MNNLYEGTFKASQKLLIDDCLSSYGFKIEDGRYDKEDAEELRKLECYLQTGATTICYLDANQMMLILKAINAKIKDSKFVCDEVKLGALIDLKINFEKAVEEVFDKEVESDYPSFYELKTKIAELEQANKRLTEQVEALTEQRDEAQKILFVESEREVVNG